MSEVMSARASSDGITFERRFSASAARVFAAWSAAEDFARWFGGAHVEVPLDRLTWDPTPGRDWSATMLLPDGSEIPWTGSFVEVGPPSRLVFDLTDEADSERDVVTVEVRADGQQSVVRFSQTGGTMPAEQYEQAMQGWLGFMDEMAAIVET